MNSSRENATVELGRPVTCAAQVTVKAHKFITEDEYKKKTMMKVIVRTLYVDDSAPVADSGRYKITFVKRNNNFCLSYVKRIDTSDKVQTSHILDSEYKRVESLTHEELRHFLRVRFGATLGAVVYDRFMTQSPS